MTNHEREVLSANLVEFMLVTDDANELDNLHRAYHKRKEEY